MQFVLLGSGFAFLVVGVRLLMLSSRESCAPVQQRRLRTSAMAFNVIAVSCFILSAIL